VEGFLDDSASRKLVLANLVELVEVVTLVVGARLVLQLEVLEVVEAGPS
jgi:hypothetical protein